MNTEQRGLDLETREIIKPSTVELRSTVEGFVKIKGIFKLGTLSEQMYDKRRNCFFREVVSSGAFVDCINKMKQSNIFPQLLTNHDWKQKLDVIDFECEEENGEFKFKYLVKKTPFIMRNMESIKAFSFGFIVGRDNWKKNINGTYTREILSFKIIKEFSILLGKEPCYSQAITEFKTSELRPCEEDTILEFGENGQVENNPVASKQTGTKQSNPELEEMKKYITNKKIEEFEKMKQYDQLKKSVDTLKKKPEIDRLKAEIEQLKRYRINKKNS
ncbi:HK97 family phage prohead protease [Clostridium perfringens]|uniref:HK97 family phage prohead protease n=1 Tax=Clostridium perfringens TaxID=1502 RepID=UPI0024BC37AE|nr:HK97 family phage prohead protease [Clostridium perfringens]